MAGIVRISTGMSNMILGGIAPTIKALLATTISFDAASGEIRDSGNAMVATGFVVGDTVVLKGTSTNTTDLTVTAVTAGALATAEGVSDEAAGSYFCLIAAKGGSLKDILKNGKIQIYSGSIPSTPDNAPSGTLLGTITVGSGAWSAGSETNGLELGIAASREISKASGEIWSFLAIADGTAGWWRFLPNETDSGAISTTAPRIDGNIGTSNASMIMASTSITTGNTYTVDSFKFTLPMQKS